MLTPTANQSRTDDTGARALALATAQAHASPNGLLVVSPKGEVLSVNRRFAEVWGLSEEVLAKRDDDAVLAEALTKVADPEAFLSRVREAYANPNGPIHEELLLADGRVLDRYGAPLRDADGTYLGWAWYFRDITEHKRTEAELRRLADTLQASLLPPRPPTIPGMEIATRYQAAQRGLRVGGDFYDVFGLGAQQWGLVIGDVCGKGAPAAALTALARYSLRAAAVHNEAPSDVLAELNAALLAEPGLGDRFCAAVYARVELDVCGAWVTLACGGHPLPIVVRRAGWVDVRGQAGTLLGLFPSPDVADDRVGLGPGDALVFCTDGITESRNDAGEHFADERLFTVLLESTKDSAERIADRAVAEALGHSSHRQRDDLAVVVLRVPDPLPPRRAIGKGYVPGEPHWGTRRRPSPPREARMRLCADPSCAPQARRFVSGVLASWRMPEITNGEAELLTSEVVANAIRHAQSPSTVIVRYDGECLRIEVGDGSPALPQRRQSDQHSLGGRGLQIIEELAERWGTQLTVGGKRVWFDLAVPPGE